MNASQPSGPLRFSMTPAAVAESLSGAIHAVLSDGAVRPQQFTNWVASRIGKPDVDVLTAQSGGARLRLLTTANRIRITVAATRTGFGPLMQGDDVFIAADADEWAPVTLEPAVGRYISSDGDSEYTVRDGSLGVLDILRPHHSTSPAVDVFLPPNVALDILAVDADAPIAARAEEPRPRWLHHGSSISHGGHLKDPRRSWPAIAGAALGLETLNASLPGNSLLDPCVAEELASVDADLVSLEIGINVVNWDSHIERTFVPALHGFLDHFYRASPERQLILISPFHCEIQETNGGPIDIKDDLTFVVPTNPRPEALTLTRVRELMARVVGSRPAGSVRLIDGLSLLGAEDEWTLEDRLHPNAAGTKLIAERFVALVDPDSTGLSRP